MEEPDSKKPTHHEVGFFIAIISINDLNRIIYMTTESYTLRYLVTVRKAKQEYKKKIPFQPLPIESHRK
ncbi:MULTISPECIES: hypothetical protein [Acinetobacter]|uniref:hypothetical protein n=1 Tax=Acinetobacter TaxID=469 RepID=UPI0011C3B24F|nr:MULTISPECIES: hypothetical protein [Acinetobacter]WOE40632.1 hypothetical protein QSG87_12140 [Acinetobacter chinensis]